MLKTINQMHVFQLFALFYRAGFTTTAIIVFMLYATQAKEAYQLEWRLIIQLGAATLAAVVLGNVLNAYIHLQVEIFSRLMYENPITFKKRGKRPMPITVTYDINGHTVQFTDFSNEPAMILTADLLDEIDFRDPATIQAIDYVLYHFSPMAKFEHYLSAYSGDEVFRQFDHVELGRLLDNPLLEDNHKRLIRGYLAEQNRKQKRPTRPRSAAGYVYLIQADLPGRPCKIGKSVNVPDRLKLFGVKLPFDFDLLHTIPCADHHQAETDLHERFADKRVNGEWFNLSDQDITDIRRIKNL